MMVEIEGINMIKKDGTRIPCKFDPSNLTITELNLEDKRRFGEQKKKTKGRKKEAGKGKQEEKNAH